MHAEASSEVAGLVGFIGLGLLGQAMALRLARQGVALVVWNREADRLAPLATAGATVAASPREVAERCAVVCLCVLDGDAVRTVTFGTDGIVQAGPDGRVAVIVDFSTVEPDETRTIAGEAALAGIEWVDAPVSGGPTAAGDGALTVMVGGAASAVHRVDALLRMLARNVNHLGDIGAGQAMKVLNQALVGGTFVLLAETLALARGLGLPADRVPACLEGGLADSAALQRAWPRMASEDFGAPTGRAAQMLKDLKGVARAITSGKLGLPLLATATARYQAYVDSGAGDEETLSITRLYGGQKLAIRPVMSPTSSAASGDGPGGVAVTVPAEAVARIIIDNPPLNVLTQSVRRRLGDVLLDVDARHDVRCVIFGSGPRAFCAGADLTEFVQRFDPVLAIRHADNAHRMILALVELDIPAIAAVRGFCLGGGFELALGCSLRIAAASAQFGLPEIDRGVWPGTGGMVLLERLVGPAVAKRLVWSGARLDAEQALALGLVDEVVDDALLDERALELAAFHAAKPGQSVRTITQLIDRGFRAAFREHLRFERERFIEVYRTHDAREGNRAFFDKRAPVWRHE